MARSRMLRPEFFNDTEFSKLSIGARYLFCALLPHMDRNGVFWGDPQIVRSHLFPCDAKMRRSDVSRWLDELHQLGRIRLFTYQDTRYLVDLQFAAHQNIYSSDPDIYRVPVETRLRVSRDFDEEKPQLSLDLLNLNQNLNPNEIPDQKNQLSRGGACAPHKPDASEIDSETLALNQKLKEERIRRGLDPETG